MSTWETNSRLDYGAIEYTLPCISIQCLGLLEAVNDVLLVVVVTHEVDILVKSFYIKWLRTRLPYDRRCIISL